MNTTINQRISLAAALAIAALPSNALAQEAPTPILSAPMVPAASPASTATASPTDIVPLPLNTKDTPLPPSIELPTTAALPPDVPSTPLTADDAALVALRHQPNVAAAAGGVTAASGRTQQAKSALAPTVSLSAGYAAAKDIGGAGTSITGIGSSANGGNVTGTIALKQLLYDFGHTSQVAKSAAALEDASAETLTRTQSDTVLAVKQSFYGVAQAQRLVAVNEDNYRAQVLHMNEAKALQVAGIGIPSDVVRAQTAVSDAALQLNVARNNASVARVALATALGIDPQTPLTLADSSEPAPAESDYSVLVATAMKARPEILASQATLDSANLSLAAAKSSNAPAIVGSLGVGAKDTAFPPTTSSVGVGVSLSFNPFDSGFTSGRIKEAQGNVTTAQANLTSAQQIVASDVAQSYLNERLAVQRVSTAQDEVANAQEGVQLAEGRFRAGIGIFLEVTDAQQLLLAAQTNLVNARSALDQARASLSHALGATIRGRIPKSD